MNGDDVKKFADVLAKNSNGEIAVLEHPGSNGLHYIALGGIQIGRDLETYYPKAPITDWGMVLLDLVPILWRIKYKCSMSYEVGAAMLRELGKSEFDEAIYNVFVQTL